ncbi:MAG: nuclease-related domain-containing protein [Methanoregula sp.]
MAKIHGISGSTRYVLKGIKPINGKQLATFEEINHFYNNYDTVLTEIREHAEKRHDKQIADLHAKESQLDQQIKEGIDQRTREVNQHILEINEKIETSQNFFLRIIYIMQFWGACRLSQYRIKEPFHEDLNKLEQIRYAREHPTATIDQIIQNERMIVINNHKFLKENETWFKGAAGEEQVINILTGLPDGYHVLNDVILNFQKFIYNPQYLEKCQIDHIVIGPTGLFLLETKNWKKQDLEIKFDTLIRQINRAKGALEQRMKLNYRNNETPPIHTVVVSIHGFPSSQKFPLSINSVIPSQLCRFITSQEGDLSEDSIDKLIHLIPCREAN